MSTEDTNSFYTCTLCKISKPISNFSKDRHNPSGHVPRCKECKTKTHAKFEIQYGGVRKCRVCSQEKPLIDFDVNRSLELGRTFVCKACAKTKHQSYPPIPYGSRVCATCKEEKEITEFSIDRHNKQGYSKDCKICFNEKKQVQHEKHPETRRAKLARRRAMLIQATPKWANHVLIKEKFRETEQASKETGVLHACDHIIPLNGKLVSGLHVHYNLQPLTSKANLQKSNKLLPEVSNQKSNPNPEGISYGCK